MISNLCKNKHFFPNNNVSNVRPTFFLHIFKDYLVNIEFISWKL